MNYKTIIFLRFLLLIVTFGCAILFSFKGNYQLVILLSIAFIFQLFYFLYLYKTILKEFSQYVDGVRYRDFSQYYSVNHKKGLLSIFRNGYNQMSSEFLSIGKQKETQFQYLQKVLELVNTGILLYNTSNGKVLWLNEALKQLLKIPFCKNIAHIEKKSAELYTIIEQIKGNTPALTSIKIGWETINLQVSASLFQIDGELLKLIVIQNVNETIDITETQAWNKLMRVLTHEIMNSVAPISSLASTIQDNISTPGQANYNDIVLGIETIKNRSEGLLKFASSYRNLNKIEKLDWTTFFVRDVFETLFVLFEPTILERDINVEIILKDTNMQMAADRNLVEQLLINLFLNAMDAVKEVINPTIQLYASANEDNFDKIKIIDNGNGMSEEVLSKVFIPFFSTKKSGSGIGLSLGKQIMLLHKGNIQVHSIESKGTVFTLNFLKHHL